jgi:hypothetical protein
MVGFYARFILDFSHRSAPLLALKKGVPFHRDNERQDVFDALKQVLCEAPVLQAPDFGKDFVLVMDASNLAVPAVLHQRVDGELAPISYYSRLLSPAERKYSTREKECLRVIFGCAKCCVYLKHKEFELHCDNLALCWLLKRVKDVGRLGHWILRLAPFKFRVRHMRSMDNVVADALSCMFHGDCGETLEGKCASLIHSLPLVYSSLVFCYVFFNFFFFFINLLYLVWKILVGSVHALFFLDLMAKHVKLCQHFELSYAM